MKFISIFIIISLLGLQLSCLKTENNPLTELFNGLPVQKGIKIILKESKMNFEGGKTNYPPLSGHTEYVEVWRTEFNKFNYRNYQPKIIELELSRNSKEKKNNCYKCELYLYYNDDEKIIKEEYHQIIDKFKLNVNEIKSIDTHNDEFETGTESVTFYIGKNKKESINFSLLSASDTIENMIWISYKNCLEK